MYMNVTGAKKGAGRSARLAQARQDRPGFGELDLTEISSY